MKPLSNETYEKWTNEEGVYPIRKGRSVQCLVLFYDANGAVSSNAITTVYSCNTCAELPVHAVAFKSYSLDERTISVFGESTDDAISFDCRVKGQGQQFDKQCFIPPCGKGVDFIAGQVTIPIVKQAGKTPRAEVVVTGNVRILCASEHTDLDHTYSLSLSPQ